MSKLTAIIAIYSFAILSAVSFYYAVKTTKKFWIQLFTLLFTAFNSVLWTTAFYPGNLSPDSIDSWEQAISGQYTDHHPVIMALIMKIFYFAFGNQIQFYTLFQSFFFYFSVFFLIKEVTSSSKLVNVKTYLYSVILFSLIPIVWVYSVILWKDVLISIFCNFLAAFLIRFFRTNKTLDLCISLGFLFLTVLSRHNAILVLPGMLILLWILKRDMRLKFVQKAAVGLAFLATAFGSQVINSALNVRPAGLKELVLASALLGYDRRLEHETNIVHEPSRVFWDHAISSPNGYQELSKRNEGCGDEWQFVMDRKINSQNLVSYIQSLPGGLVPVLGDFVLHHPIISLEANLCGIKKLVLARDNLYYWGVVPNAEGITWSPLDGRLKNFATSRVSEFANNPLKNHLIYLFFLAGAFFVLIRDKVYDSIRFQERYILSRPTFAVLSCIGLSYFLSMCVVPQIAWRYLLLTFCLAWAAILPMFVELSTRIYKRLIPQRN
jgi:hypothetical protein